jgi:two-component sensor histidine kinase
VAIEWSLTCEGKAGEEVLVWRWQESGGPEVAMPKRQGFGSFLVEHVLASDFGGAVQVDYHPDGLRCTLTAAIATEKLPAFAH